MPKIIITEPGETPQPYRLDPDHKVAHVGRGQDCDIVIKCGSVSKKHCTMERVKGGYILRDQDSTNGIKLDGSLMEVIDLEDGMEVLVGDVPFKFQLSGDEMEKLGEEEFTPHQKKKLPPIEPEKAPRKEPPVNLTREEKPLRARADEAKPPSAPAAAAYNPYRPQTTFQQSGSPLKTLLVFVLVIACIFTGLSIRHKMRTGESLPSKILNWLNQTPAAGTEQSAESAKTGQADDEDGSSGEGDDPDEASSPGAPATRDAGETPENGMMR